MPILIGCYGNFLMPTYLGASEVVYPRINNISVLIIFYTFKILILTMINEYTNGMGWTLYPPLSVSIMTLTSVGIDFILYSLIFLGVSSTFTSLNFLNTLYIWKLLLIPIICMDIYLLSIVLVGYILIIVLPILATSIILIIFDLHYNTVFYDTFYGGDPIFYQHIFWYLTSRSICLNCSCIWY